MVVVVMEVVRVEVVPHHLALSPGKGSVEPGTDRRSRGYVTQDSPPLCMEWLPVRCPELGRARAPGNQNHAQGGREQVVVGGAG